jgi:DNA (cytosine-5)-methyltransferase 1
MNKSNKTYKIASFFAGIGGFDIAFERNGFETTYLCEINPFCQSILKDHWPDVKKDDDINEIDIKKVPCAQVWCGGFPCQDISVARGKSKRLGLSGTRSGLFYHYAELIEQAKPKVVVIENVEGLFTSNGGRDFGVILQTMTSMGYAVGWRLLNSRYFGVPQSRTRVYMCCWLNQPGKVLNVMFDKEGAEKPKPSRADFITESNKPDEYPKVPKVSYCLAATSGRHTGTDWSRTYVVCRDGVRRMTPLESERLQGFPDNWTATNNYQGDAENLNTLRYTAIGNAVSVPVVEWLAKRLYKELGKSPSESLNIANINELIPEFKDSKWMTNLSDIDFSDDEIKHKWERGGIAWKGSVIQCTINPTPSSIVESSLYDLIEKDDVASSYYLSPNAAEGILRRVDHQGRTLFAPLRIALEKLKQHNNHG